MASFKDLDVSGKRVLLRVDYNVPLENGKVVDAARIESTLPTLKALLDKGCSLVLMSHLGRPKGKPVPEFSLRPAAVELSRLLGKPVGFAEDCVGPSAKKAVDGLKPGSVLLLENLRFHKEEEGNDPAFARELAAHGDVFVQDAFGAAHRAHASTAGVPALLPSAAGLLVEKELEFLGGVIKSARKPFVAVLGGSKVSDKLAVTRNLLDKVDSILIGGAMAYTFLKAQGVMVGASRIEADRVEDASDILSAAQKRGVDILLPLDHVAAPEFKEASPAQETKGPEIPESLMGLDIGPRTVGLFCERIKSAKTVLWNGPMGVFEMKPFSRGSFAVAEAMAAATALGAVTVVGGGDSLSVLKKTGLASKMSHCSTGGGASLELLEGKILPGIAALRRS